jgi:undecaprenyl diphosphate synthase
MGAVPLQALSPPPPTHVAIIMDGNGRWATGRGLRRIAGHKRGAESVKTAVDTAIRFGVRYLTLFGFSSENWKRPEDEVRDLMGLLRFYLSEEIAFLQERGIRLRVIGDRGRLGTELVALIDDAERTTAANNRLTLIIALSYGSRAEIAQAARQRAAKVLAGVLRPQDIDDVLLAEHLYTRGIPDPDLIIRTSGEKRVSNFLLWQAAYAELVFIDTLWPDFTRQDFEQALQEYRRRDRRYGAVAG